MVEPIMYFGIGFLVASLIGLVIVPLVHSRAVRLTIRRLEAATPLSMAEIQADKDQLRAEFAISTRRLEMSIDQLKTNAASQLADIGKKTDAINKLRIELGEKTATILALEAREKLLKDQVRAHEDDLEVKSAALGQFERTLSERDAELVTTNGTLTERSTLADTQRVELAALNAQVDALKSQLDDAVRAVRDTEERLGKTRTEADTASTTLAGERGKVENLGTRVAELERQLIAQSTEAEMSTRRVAELEQQLGDHAKLREGADGARKTEADLRAELAGAESRHQAAMALLQAEIAGLKRQPEGGAVAEQMESALLRERINEIAAEVARLAVALEGPDSPIEAILAETGTNGVNGAKTRAKGTAPEGSNLADRIRALQARAAQMRQ